MKNTIAFPGLGIGAFTIPTSFRFFGFTIHFYGVIIALGIVLAYLFAKKKAKRRGITNDSILDVIIWGLPSAIICARLYYVIFSWESYKDNIWDVFKIWEGGIAIYGAVIGACISTLVYCCVKKVPVLKMFDVGAFGLLIGQIVGRWGNFINAEVYGKETHTALLRMQILNKNVMVHPTFLYESLWNILLFIFLNLFEKKQKFDGEIFLWYITGYSFARSLLELLRDEEYILKIGNCPVSALIAAIFFVTGLGLIVYFRLKKKNEVSLDTEQA